MLIDPVYPGPRQSLFRSYGNVKSGLRKYMDSARDEALGGSYTNGPCPDMSVTLMNKVLQGSKT